MWHHNIQISCQPLQENYCFQCYHQHQQIILNCCMIHIVRRSSIAYLLMRSLSNQCFHCLYPHLWKILGCVGGITANGSKWENGKPSLNYNQVHYIHFCSNTLASYKSTSSPSNYRLNSLFSLGWQHVEKKNSKFLNSVGWNVLMLEYLVI